VDAAGLTDRVIYLERGQKHTFTVPRERWASPRARLPPPAASLPPPVRRQP
jgi:hypothetical protein